MRGDIGVEINDLEEVIERLGRWENHYIQLGEIPQATPYSKAIYKRKVEVASRLRQAFQIRLKRRNQILKGKTQDFTEWPDSEISDGGYSYYSDIEASPYREKSNIQRRKMRRKYPRVEDFWLIWDTSQWAYIIMIHEWILIWDSYFADILHN